MAAITNRASMSKEVECVYSYAVKESRDDLRWKPVQGCRKKDVVDKDKKRTE
jgi:hypothetical protein